VLGAAFLLFGPGHLLALALTILIPLCLGAWARRHEAAAHPVAAALALLLVANRLLALGMAARADKLTLDNALPMHLCDWATVVVVLALVGRNQLLFELSYYWGLAGTLQAVLTPDLAMDFTDVGAWTFFIAHSGIIVGAVYLVRAFGLRPRRGAVWRVFGWSQVYLATAALVNSVSGSNYGYLCAKPLHASLLDHLGPWPFYLLSLEALALLLFILVGLPFWWPDRSRRDGPRED
jgi:hypothetical integral membrane protein (TIGR02206 family)